MRVLIVGGGIGGLALASFLEKSEIDYLLVERDKDWSRHGFSLGMWSNGRAMLQKLGVAERFDAAAVPYHRLSIHTFAGKALKTYDLSKFYVDFGLGYSHIARQDLHDWLLSGTLEREVKMETTVSSLTFSDVGVSAVFDNGESQVFDLVVGADGAHSGIRNSYFEKDVEKYIDWRVWYAVSKKRWGDGRTVSEYLQPGLFLGVFDDFEKSLIIFCAAVKHEKFDVVQGRKERLRNLFGDVGSVNRVLDELDDAEILPTDLVEVQVGKWVKDRLVLIGDAAHAFEPFAGLGGSMALEDAYVLSTELLKVTRTYSLATALAVFEQKRKPRVEEARHITRKMKLWATVKSPFLRKTIDAVAPFVPESYFARDFLHFMSKEL